MKKLWIAILAVVMANGLSAQIVKLDEVMHIKNSKMVVALTEDDDVNESLKKMVESFWSFSEVDEYLPREEAFEKAKNNKDIVVLAIGTTTSISGRHGRTTGYSYRTISRGKHLEISNGKGKAIIKNFIPAFGEEEYITDEILAFGLTAIEYLCKTMEEDKLKTNWKFKSAYKVHSRDIKSKTLYLMDGWVSEKIKKEDIRKAYEAPIAVVTQEKWADAILSKKEGIAYCIVVPATVGGKFVYMHYIVDAHTGVVYGIAYPKVAVDVAGVNVSKSNSGYINKKNLKAYADIGEGKW